MEISLFSFMVTSIFSYIVSSFEQNEEQTNQPKFSRTAFGLNQFFNTLIYAYETCQRLLLCGWSSTHRLALVKCLIKPKVN